MDAKLFGWLTGTHDITIPRLLPALMFLQISLAFIGCLFWFEAQMQGEAFSAEIYGTLAVQYPAEYWAIAMMAGSAITFNGLMHPIQRGWIILGSFIHAFCFSMLAVSAIFYQGQFVIGVFSSVCFLTPHVWLAIEAYLSEPQ